MLYLETPTQSKILRKTKTWDTLNFRGVTEKEELIKLSTGSLRRRRQSGESAATGIKRKKASPKERDTQPRPEFGLVPRD